MSTKNKTHVKVFMTKTLRFRARITEAGKPAYEVSIGGKNWAENVGRLYEPIIILKINRIMDTLFKNYTSALADRRLVA